MHKRSIRVKLRGNGVADYGRKREEDNYLKWGAVVAEKQVENVWLVWILNKLPMHKFCSSLSVKLPARKAAARKHGSEFLRALLAVITRNNSRGRTSSLLVFSSGALGLRPRKVKPCKGRCCVSAVSLPALIHFLQQGFGKHSHSLGMDCRRFL